MECRLERSVLFKRNSDLILLMASQALIKGEFIEAHQDLHVRSRSELLGNHQLPPLSIASSPVSLADFINGEHHVQNLYDSARVNGCGTLSLEDPLDDDRFVQVGERFGQCQEELDEDVQAHVSKKVILNLRTDRGLTRDTRFQPFSSNFLTLHTEGSGRRIEDQPRYIILMCVEAGFTETAGQTVVVLMESIIKQLSAESIEILRCTRYDNDSGSPYILRYSEGRWVICFRDFYDQILRWVHEGNGTTDQVNSAIRGLLIAYYTAKDAQAIYWKRGLVVVLDNHHVVHGRSDGRFESGGLHRHLKRIRVLDNAKWLIGEESISKPSLFSELEPVRVYDAPLQFGAPAESATGDSGGPIQYVDDRTIEVFERAEDPTDPYELRDLWLGRVEAEMGNCGSRQGLAARWKRSRPQRNVGCDEILNSQATVSFVKEMFNFYFRDDLYGELHSNRHLILSSGAAEESLFGLPNVLKQSVRYALDRDWYGYSDSRGRESAREALALFESVRVPGANYSLDNIAITLGATFAVNNLGDFILSSLTTSEAIVCGIPNYPPLVKSLSRRNPVRLVPFKQVGGSYSIKELASAVTSRTPLVFLQTVVNPTGLAVSEDELSRFIAGVSPSTIIILDESHECLGPQRSFCRERARSNVIRISSISKDWSAPGMKAGWIVADPDVIVDYYEHASSSFGGPASFLFTMLEVMGRFEAWRISQTSKLTDKHFDSFGGQYGLGLDVLSRAYDNYCLDRRAREAAIRLCRQRMVNGLTECGLEVVSPEYSINLIVALTGYSDSYLCFRDLLRKTGVSVYPSILSFCLAEPWVRVTYALPSAILTSSINRIRKFEKHSDILSTTYS